MRSVGLTERKPEWVLSATAHSTECTMTKTRLIAPRPNHNSASGNSAIAGSGLNMAVSVDRKSVPTRVETASVVKTPAASRPMRIAHGENAQRGQRAVDQDAVRGRIPKRRERLGSATGNSSGLSRIARVDLPGRARARRAPASRRTSVILASRSNSVSGRAASPISPVVSGATVAFRPQRRQCGVRVRLSMVISRHARFARQRGLDPIREQQIDGCGGSTVRKARVPRSAKPRWPALSSALTWPGCGDSTRTRLPISSASSIEWVTKITVKPTSSHSAHQLFLHLAPGQRVEGGERLVHQQHRGLHGQRAGDGDALLHAAGQHVRIDVFETRRD